MRLPSLLLLSLSLSSLSQASSWFGSSDPAPPYSTWSASELKSWLQAHDISLPSKHPSQADLRNLVDENWNTISTWTYDQYATAQKSFSDIRGSSFDKWDESRLREFLLAQGVVAPKGPKENLVHLANSQYRAFQNAASSFSDRASSTIYGDPIQQATQSLSSFASKASDSVVRTADATKDYVYSTWDDSEIIKYLESKGVKVQDSAKKSRSQLLALMSDAYAKVANPIYDAWSDSYIHDWLVHHNIIAPTPPSPYSREFLLNKMKEYYYDANDTVYSTWSDSQIKQWLVKQGIVKTDAQIKRDKLVKIMQDNYLSARETIFSAWSDSQIRDWLVERKYIDDRNAAQIKRDELVNLIAQKYHSATTPSYLAWPDARLRAYLRENNVPEDKVPTSRPGLLQETRILWARTQTNSEALWAKVKDIVGGVEEGVEERLWRMWNMLKGNYGQGQEYVEDKFAEGKDYAGAKYDEGREKAGKKYDEAYDEVRKDYRTSGEMYEKEKERAYGKAQDARENVGEKVKKGGQKIKGEL